MPEIDIRKKLRPETIFQDLAAELDKYKEHEVNSVTFLVDSSPDGAIKILIKYPGRKVRNRELKQKRTNSVHWEYLYDFLVIPVFKGKELPKEEFTYRKILKDFEQNKNNDDSFWKAILEILNNNKVVYGADFQNLRGISPPLFLYVLKWLWIQEDFNYRLNHTAFISPTRYRLPTGKSLGRKKFFAGLALVHSGLFTAEECAKL